MKTVIFGDRLFETELIIFDKDGTLMDFKKVWLPVLKKRIELVLASIDPALPKERIKKEIHRVYGVTAKSIDQYESFDQDKSSDSFESNDSPGSAEHHVSIDSLGPFIYTSRREDIIIIASVLYRFGIPWHKAKTISQVSAEKVDTIVDRTALSEIEEAVKKTLKDLHDKGVPLALATADQSNITHNILKTFGIHDLFDYIIGSDMVEMDKPDPEMLKKTISHFNADQKKVAFVGDTITDMEMGRRAKIGLVVGVLEYGITQKSDLEKYANVVIDSLRDIRPIK